MDLHVDEIAINILDWNVSHFECMGTKIINNEFAECDDGIQISRALFSGTRQSVDFQGTIIDSNVIYITSAIYGYTAENAIDVKGGTSNASNPIIVTNNKIWGYMGTGTADSATVFHYTTENLKFNNNILFNNKIGFGTGSSGDATYNKGIVGGEVTGNLFYNSGVSPKAAVKAGSSQQLNIHDNTQIDTSYQYGYFTGLYDSTFYSDNIHVDCTTSHYSDGCSSEFNTSLSSIIVENRSLYTEDIVVDYDVFTQNPKQITLTNAVKP